MKLYRSSHFTLDRCLMMYLWWSLCTLYLHACQVKRIVGNSGLCYCVCVMSFERYLTPLCRLFHTDWWQKGKESLSKIWTDQHSHVNIRKKKTVLRVLNWPLQFWSPWSTGQEQCHFRYKSTEYTWTSSFVFVGAVDKGILQYKYLHGYVHTYNTILYT